MTTDDVQEGSRLQVDEPARLPLAEALRIIAFGQGLTPADYSAKVDKHPARLEVAFQELCDAAYQSHMLLEGVDPRDNLAKPIPPLRFGPGDHGEAMFSRPPGGKFTTEQPSSIAWRTRRRRGSPKTRVCWEDVHVDRASLERWLQPRTPDPAQFDPMAKVYWTVPMAVAWIASKTADAVRNEWNDWLAGCHARRRDEDGCYWEAARAAASLAVLRGWDSKNEAAWHELRNALLKGEAKGGITATGIITNGGERVAISAAEWNDLYNYPTGTDLVEKFRYDPNSRNPDRGYDEILLERDDVMQLGSAEPSRAAVAESDRPKRKRGPKEKFDWARIEPIARHRFETMGGADENPLIEAIQKDVRAAGLLVPSRASFQPKLIEWKLY